MTLNDIIRVVFAPAVFLSCAAISYSDDALAARLANQVTIYRDAWGVPHILGPTDESVVFGMGYAQSEDYFWQLEDTTIRGIGRYSEIVGKAGFRSDMTNRAFEIVSRSKTDYDNSGESEKKLVIAFVEGVNWYLKHNPKTKPRLIERFEPWMILATNRHLLLDFSYAHAHASRPKQLFDQDEPEAAVLPPASSIGIAAREAIGSNAWAIAPTKTASKNAMLLVNPHQPWHGWGQFYEAHLHSDQTIRFSGACFFGTPFPTIGHNEHLGWTYTVNAPDNADAWTVTFDSEDDPLAYRFDNGYRRAVEWTDTILVRKGKSTEARTVTFRKTHHGPIVNRVGEDQFLAVNVAGVFDNDRAAQALGMIRAKNLAEWQAAVAHCALPMFNVAYADRDGNILYLYNGSIPIRDKQFQWRSPVDGSTSKTDWKGIHGLDDLPQLLNPRCGYVQNCNTSPFLTTHDQNPDRSQFPTYMFEDADFRKRRAQLSRNILADSEDLTFEQMQSLALDTRLLWPEINLPKFKAELESLEKTDGELASKVRPYLNHLLAWDFRSTNESTQTTLCVTWYEELHQGTYPGETLKSKYQDDPKEQLVAIVKAAEKLKRLFGDWKVPWGKAHRLQRVHNKGDVTSAALALSRFRKSLPCPGVPGPLGVVYTVYSAPSIPIVRPSRYAVVGSCYVAVVEFGERIQAASAVQFGASSDPRSPHYFDQAKLFSEQRLKPAWFYPEDVKANAIRSYHPGDFSP